MRICLLSLTYPPEHTEGIARQRHVLATELADRGHDVQVIALGVNASTRFERNVHVHIVLPEGIEPFSDEYPDLDIPLTCSLALFEKLRVLHGIAPFDIVDVPLWAAQAFVTAQRHTGPVVVWLQTSTAQLRAINRQAIDRATAAQLALERFCLERATGLLSDSRIALESILRDYSITPLVPVGIAYLGLPVVVPTPARSGLESTSIEALVVGRLERRKGTPLLLDLLPQILQQHPQLTVRFAGQDNSHEDGWFQKHRLTYSSYFQQRHPALANRVLFEGYVKEVRLEQLYQQADMLLAPSLYESFGLIYLEAMRARLPVITFAVGGAQEIFVRGSADGALLVPLGNRAELAAALTRLIKSPALREQLGTAGYERFLAAFSAGAMADATLAFYETVINTGRSEYRNSKIIHAMEALDVGDAVSNIARDHAHMLANFEQPSTIYARYWHEQLRDEVQPIAVALATPAAHLIFHYWNYNSSTWLIHALRGRKAIYYHNITPSAFYPIYSDEHSQSERGHRQLREIINDFDLLIAASHYNLSDLTPWLNQPKPAICIYPVIEKTQLRAQSYTTKLVEELRISGDYNILFVGRIARNKRQDLLIKAFDYYWQHINRHARLWLVGNDSSDPAYRSNLGQLISQMPSGKHITFTSKVSAADLHAYYRGADLFLCASEHEGFCVPIAQAMAYDIPVIAYAAAAVPETLGGTGLLIHTWDSQRVGELIGLMQQDPVLRQTIIAQQQAVLPRFSAQEAHERLAAVVTFLTQAIHSPRFEQIHPHDS